jgi:hypothetical protein
MKIEKIDKLKIFPEIIQTILRLEVGEVIKISDYNKKSPLPQYIGSYVRNGVIKKGMFKTQKINKETYYLTKIK